MLHLSPHSLTPPIPHSLLSPPFVLSPLNSQFFNSNSPTLSPCDLLLIIIPPFPYFPSIIHPILSLSRLHPPQFLPLAVCVPHFIFSSSSSQFFYKFPILHSFACFPSTSSSPLFIPLFPCPLLSSALFIIPANNQKFHYICPYFHSLWKEQNTNELAGEVCSNPKRQAAHSEEKIFSQAASPGAPWTLSEESGRSDNNKMSPQSCQEK